MWRPTAMIASWRAGRVLAELHVNGCDAAGARSEGDSAEFDLAGFVQAVGVLKAAHRVGAGFAEIFDVGDRAVGVEAEVDEVAVELTDIGAGADALLERAIGRHAAVHEHDGQVVDTPERAAAADYGAD